MQFSSDIAIIGAGPVGLFTAFQAGMLGLKCIIIDALEHIGGQCNALYPQKPIYDIPAYPEISAEKLIDNLYKQAKPFNPEFLLNNEIINIEKKESEFVLTSQQGNEINVKAVIIASGCGKISPKKLPITNAEKFEGKGLEYMVKNPSNYAGKNIVIAGGGDSAIDWALNLSEVAKSITIVHRRDKFRAAPSNVEQVRKLAEIGKVNLVIPYQLNALHGSDSALQAVEVIDFDGRTKLLDADSLLAFFGLAMTTDHMKQWGLQIEKNHIKVDVTNMCTNISGIYAVGDAVDYTGKLKLILTGFAESSRACYSAYEYINPNKPMHFEYSTNKGIPTN